MKFGSLGFLALLRPGEALKCTRCEYHQDHDGNVLGISDLDCFEKVVDTDKYQVDCPNLDGAEACITEVKIDWRPDGHQEMVVKRDCGVNDGPAGNQGCNGNHETFPPPDNIFRDCLKYCNSDDCNARESDFLLASGLHSSGREPNSLSCHICSFTEKQDSSINGNVNCRANATLTVSKKCPIWADYGCFTAGSWIDETGLDGKKYSTENDYRGCSSFLYDPLLHNNGDCHGYANGDNNYSNCKYTCDTGNNCNINPLAKKKQCHTCTATRDMGGNSIGVGDKNCWEDAHLTSLVDCENESDVCINEIIVDWSTRGSQIAQVKRGCSSDAPKTECDSGSSSKVMYKDCATSCSTSGCNTDYDGVAGMFNPAGPKVNKCQACTYIENDNGGVSGNKKCGGEGAAGVSVSCPAYADAACYVGNNIHVAGSGKSSTYQVKEEVYRGCSTFNTGNEGNDAVCTEETLGGITGENHAYGVCKSTCFGPDCNNKAVTRPDVPVEGNFPVCNVCSAWFDQNNQTAGTGDLGCIEGGDKYNQLCPNQGDICVSELSVDWQPRGNMQYRISRSCYSQTVPPKCFEGTSSLVSYKDCMVGCNPGIHGSGCNNGMDAVSDKFDVGNVNTCYACEFYQGNDGNVNGSPDCAAIIDDSSKIPTQSCPRYANAGCYHSASFHLSYSSQNGDETVEDDYRGCSPFDVRGSENRPYCTEQNINGLEHKNCKEVCTNNYCNTQKIQKTKRCFSCTATRNSLNETMGTGSNACFDDVDDSMAVDCRQEDEWCVDELIIDWVLKGEQWITMKRGCAKAPANGPCLVGSYTKYKDCQHSCFPFDDIPCNNGLEVAEKYKEDAPSMVSSCHTCRYVEHDDGTVEGNKNCKENPAIAACPSYAQVACYTGAAVHNTDKPEIVMSEVYKACSTFEIEGGEAVVADKLPNDNGDIVEYSMTYSSCTSDNCNKEHKEPVNPEFPIIPDEGVKCQVCSVTVDHNLDQVGTGSIGCWNGDAAFEADCSPQAPHCQVTMEIDWLPRGQFTYRILRGCSTKPANDHCNAASSSLVQYKDCQVSCEPAKDGNGCNDGLTEISAKFSVGKVSECYKCEFYEDFDGNVNGLPTCGAQINDKSNVPVATCPLFADAACYWAGSYHDDYMVDNIEFEDDFRGCSPFTLTRNDECVSSSINGLDHLNCKGTCESNNCNDDKITRHVQCNQCTASVNSQGENVGASDLRCLNNVGDDSTFLADCPAGTTHCVDELMTDWFSKGAQVTTIIRGCAPKGEQKTECTETASQNAFLFKDCYHYCEGDGCNNDLTVADQYQDEDGFMQTSCYACKYIENDAGTTEGNINCPDEPTDAMKSACPVYANVACYTGTALHNFEGDDKEEVYKGCSTFNLEAPMFSSNDVNGLQYELVKETCRNTANCNVGHTTPVDKKRCHTCIVRRDHMGNQYGMGDNSCWDAPDSTTYAYCPNDDDVCITKMSVEWFIKGEQVVTLHRTCGSKPVFPGGDHCFENNGDTYKAKECLDYCEDDLCNSERDVEEYFNVGDVTECYSCQYGQDPHGNILPNSNIYCQANDASSLVPTQNCPIYANAGCYSAATWHYENNVVFEEDFKGCSTFVYPTEHETCSDYVYNGMTYKNCRSTCVNDKCNTKTPEKRMSCYTCDHTIDAEGNGLGVGSNPSCFTDMPDVSLIQECDVDEQFCFTDLETDWFFTGLHTWRVRRGCAKRPPMTPCAEFETTSGQMKFKDCQVACPNSNCNHGLDDVSDLFDSGIKGLSCYTCSFEEDDFGNAIGQRDCMDNADLVVGAARDCPRYANTGCFVGSNLHNNEDGDAVESVFKGCSSFTAKYSPNCMVEQDYQGSGNDVAVCKELCAYPPNCNVGHTRPELDESNYLKCHQCSVYKNHLGKIVGTGDRNCWDKPSEDDYAYCGNGQACVTEMTVEWFPRGEHVIKMDRKCDAPVSNGAFACSVNTNSNIKEKKCKESCSDSLCNNDNNIENYFDQGNDLECFSCQFVQYPDGSLVNHSNKNCQNPTAVDGVVDTLKCPKYLNGACFSSATWHTGSGKSWEEDYKGCTAFTKEDDEPECSTMVANGEDVTSCSNTCTGDKCNNKTPTKTLSCYTCDVTVDGFNNTIGYGESDCWSESPDSKYVEECNAGQDYCITEIEADWMLTGKQTWRVRRKCSNLPALDYCYEYAGSSMYLKDCATHCKDSACNDGLLETAQMYDSKTPQQSCYSCEHVQKEFGNDRGNKYCGDEPEKVPQGTNLCPVYANAGCFTGNNAHYDSSANYFEEVYKGCSSFALPESECQTLKNIEIDGIRADFGICKETCFGNLCNSGHLEPPTGGKTCYSCNIMRDHLGNFVGMNNNDAENCWSHPNPNDKTNCDEGEVCLTEMAVDWFDHGEQFVRLSRRCGPKMENSWTCQQNSDNNLFYSKKCVEQCEGDYCNDNLNVENLFSQRSEDLECFSCLYGESANGNLKPNSNIYCTDKVAEVGTVPITTCPKYADAACYTAATWHYNQDGAEFEEDYKGCSTFKVEDDEKCGSFDSNGENHEHCRETCDNDLCNKFTPSKRLSCYTCDVTMDHMNSTVGYGNPTCFSDVPDSILIEECGTDANYCVTDLEADWHMDGYSTWRVRRGCSVNPAPSSCWEYSTETRDLMLKDCSVSCDTAACNDGLDDVATKFSQGNVDKCHVCTFMEEGDSTSGNTNCDKQPDSSTSCPIYADAGCFTGSNAVYTSNEVFKNSISRGCSSFMTEKSCYEIPSQSINEEESTFGVCKESCVGNNCNNDDDFSIVKRPKCLNCRVQKDHMGNILGYGDEGCWTGDDISNLETCDANQVCMTTMTVQWGSKGEQSVEVVRSCGDPIEGAWKCRQQSDDVYKEKVCSQPCDGGDGCNNNLDIENVFSSGNDDLTCFSCQYGEFYNGINLPNSNVNCQNGVAIEGEVPTQACPKYANQGCFTASTWRYNDDGSSMEEDYKGCSSFKLDEDENDACGFATINGLPHESCRSYCNDNNCNSQTPVERLACFTCEAVFDAEMNIIGVGDANCYSNQPHFELAEDCAAADKYCQTDIEADWMINGKQQYRIRRGCAKDPAPEKCWESSSADDQILFKDCYTSCDDSFCNYDFDETAQKLSTGKSIDCYQCEFIETEDNDVIGNKYCSDQPDQIDVSISCPVFADAACFTGTNARYRTDATIAEEVYKGCSTFNYGESKCSFISQSTVAGTVNETVNEVMNNYENENTNIGICKETCQTGNCNLVHERPDIPPMGGGNSSALVSYISIFSVLLPLVLIL